MTKKKNPCGCGCLPLDKGKIKKTVSRKTEKEAKKMVEKSK